MRGIRRLLVACTIMASIAVPLGLPAVALADSVAVGPAVAITGAVESRPAEGIAGTWVVDGTEFQAVEGTRLIEAAGPAEVDAQVAVLAWRTADGSLQAFVIRVQSASQTARLQAVMTQVRRALGLAARLRLRTFSQDRLQTQTQLQTQEQLQEQAQEQLREQTQQQLQDRTQTQQQLRDQTQEQTQQQLRDQTQEQTQQQLQDQSQEQAQLQTRSMFGH